jgi:hypothetical protein
MLTQFFFLKKRRRIKVASFQQQKTNKNKWFFTHVLSWVDWVPS